MSAELVSITIERDVVIAEGSEAADYLEGQLSQDIAGLEVGDSAWSFLLEPTGKVVALFRVTRADDQQFLLDIDPGWGEAVIKRLERFKLRTECSFTLETWSGVAWRGPGSEAVVADAPIVAEAGWDSVQGVDVIGPDIDTGGLTADNDTFESLRIAARWPAMGSEIDESTIPNSTGVVDVAASFTKGCYTGQELVARIHSRGNNTPTRLVRVQADDEETRMTVGADIVIDDAVVGTITSASAVTADAIGYLKRAIDVPAAAYTTAADQPPARVNLST